MDLLSLITAGGIIEPWSIALVCIGLCLAGFVDAIAGGGGLISTPTFLIAGLPIHSVIATNKLSNSMGTAIATIKYIKEGFMRWQLVLPCMVLALLGSVIGANVMLISDDTVLRVMMLIVIPIAGFYVLRTKDFGASRQAWGTAKTLGLCCVISLVIGLYDGFYGPGTGTFLMLLFTGLGRLAVTDAAGITKAINLTTNVSALVVLLVNGAVMIPIGLLGGCFSIVGNYLGARLFTEKGAHIVRPIMLVVLVIFAIRVIAELAGLA